MKETMPDGSKELDRDMPCAFFPLRFGVEHVQRILQLSSKGLLSPQSEEQLD